MEHFVLPQGLSLCILLLLALGTVRSVENVTGTVGKSVYLTVKLDLPAQRQVTWKVNSSTQIVTAVTGGSPVYFGDYGGRCTLYENTTLRLDNLTPTDTGEYTLTVANTGTGATQSGSVYLTVNSPLTPPTLRVNVSTTNGNAYPVNGTIVSLHCDAGGQNVVNYTFSQDGVTACSQPHVTCDKDFLYFQPIMMSDTGRYTCKIENPISSNTSQPLSLTVIGSPDGKVQCNVVKLDQTVRLSCSWPGGSPAATVTLMFENNRYTALDTVTTDVPLNAISSGAELSCLGTQEGQISVSTMILGTPFGSPSNSISSVKKGENVTMSVSLAWSRTVSPRIQALPATFSWFHLNPEQSLLTNGGKSSVISSHYKSELVISSVTASESGIYECEAENVMGKSTFLFELSVTASNQLSPGAIAGIVIAALFVVALIPLTVIFILRKKNKNNTSTPTNPVYENTGAQAPNTYDRIITGSTENMARNKPQESSYQELQFPHTDLYNNFRKTPR